MQKALLFLLIGSGIFAQARENTEPGFSGRYRTAPEKISVTGNLALLNGRIILKSGDTTYYVKGIDRLIGFVDGLKEGAQISLEGFARNFRGNEKAGLFIASKLTIADRSYDLGFPGDFRRTSGGHHRNRPPEFQYGSGCWMPRPGMPGNGFRQDGRGYGRNHGRRN